MYSYPFKERIDQRVKTEIDKTVCASFNISNHFKKVAEATIVEKYNVDEIETRILSEKFSNRLFSTLDKIYKNIIPRVRNLKNIRYIPTYSL